jgi:ribose transport system substrate-binding protein
MSGIMKSLRVVAILAAVLALSTGCGGGKPKVAFVTNNPESFWSIVEAGTRKAAQEEPDIEVLFRKPAQGDAAVQKEVVDTVVNQGVKAVAVSVIDPKNQSAYFKEVAGKTALLTVDNDAKDSGRLCYIGTDNYEAGRAAGRLIQEAMPDGGVLAVFVGDLSGVNARERRQGVLDELAGAKGKELSGVDDGKGEMFGKYKLFRTYVDQPEGPQKAKENAVDAITELQKEPNVCMIGLWAYNPPAILSAVEDKGKLGKIKMVGFDEDPKTLEGIASGHIHGTIVQNPFQFGYQAVKVMAALTRGDKSKIPESKILPIDFRIITKEGGKDYPETVNGVKKSIAVKEFSAELDQLLGK